MTVLPGNHWLRPVTRALFKQIDELERTLLLRALAIPMLFGAMVRRLGTSRQVLYRAINAAELDDLRKNEWRYDTGDARNSVKFATPSLESARSLLEPGGAIIRVVAHQALPYWKLSRFWNLPGPTSSLREHIFLPQREDRIELLSAGRT